MEKERMSYHPSVQQMYDRIAKDKMANVWDRYEALAVSIKGARDVIKGPPK